MEGNGNGNNGEPPQEQLDGGDSSSLREAAPLAGGLAIDAHETIIHRMNGLRAEGKMVELVSAVLVLRLRGRDVPEGQGALVAGTRGAGEVMAPDELIHTLAESVSKTCDAADYQDPLLRGAAYGTAAETLVGLLGGIATRRTGGWFRSLLLRLPSLSRERELVAIVNQYVTVIDEINRTGTYEPDAPSTSDSVDDLTREDFEE